MVLYFARAANEGGFEGPVEVHHLPFTETVSVITVGGAANAAENSLKGAKP